MRLDRQVADRQRQITRVGSVGNYPGVCQRSSEVKRHSHGGESGSSNDRLVDYRNVYQIIK